MVLDIRYLYSDPGAELVGRQAAPGNHRDSELEQLLNRAMEPTSPVEQARVIEQLRRIIPGPEGMERLWEISSREGDPRRLIAVQLLGFHRYLWLSSRSRLRQILEWARREQDPAMASALVWCLRQRSESSEFLKDHRPAVAREAALGLPLNRQTLPYLLKTVRALRPPFSRTECGRILLGKLRNLHPSLVRVFVDLLLEQGWNDDPALLVPLLEGLPQVPLFEIFLEERGLPDWQLQPPEQMARSRAWQQLGRAARQVLEAAPSAELLRYLLTRSGEDDAFIRRHEVFLRAVLHRADEGVGAELIAYLEHLTFRASEEMVARLAQLLVELSRRLEGEAGAQAATLLESWKNRSAELKLKIYHLQHKLGMRD